jgi:hypothetical protein
MLATELVADMYETRRADDCGLFLSRRIAESFISRRSASMKKVVRNFPLHFRRAVIGTTHCLQCGRIIELESEEKSKGHWYSCLRCQLDVEIFCGNVGYGNSEHMWIESPVGTLTVFAWEKQ